MAAKGVSYARFFSKEREEALLRIPCLLRSFFLCAVKDKSCAYKIKDNTSFPLRDTQIFWVLFEYAMLLKSSILISLYPKRKGKETRILLLRDTQIEDLNQPS